MSKKLQLDNRIESGVQYFTEYKHYMRLTTHNKCEIAMNRQYVCVCWARGEKQTIRKIYM